MPGGLYICKPIWQEYEFNHEQLFYDAEVYLAKIKNQSIENMLHIPSNAFEGKERLAVIKQRVNQDAFRAMILNNYNFKCAISGTWDKTNFTLSGSSRIDNLTLKSGSCFITCSGASEIAGISSINSDKVQLSMSGATALKFEKIRSGIINASASGVGKLKTLEVNANELLANFSGASSVIFSEEIGIVSVELDGASSLSLQGDGDKMSVTASGTATFNGKSFTVKDASVNLSGVSGATVTVTQKLETETSGNSHIDYYGNPQSVNSKTKNVVKH